MQALISQTELALVDYTGMAAASQVIIAQQLVTFVYDRLQKFLHQPLDTHAYNEINAIVDNTQQEWRECYTLVSVFRLPNLYALTYEVEKREPNKWVQGHLPTGRLLFHATLPFQQLLQGEADLRLMQHVLRTDE